MDNAPPTRIFLRPLGSPATIGMAGLAVASLVQSGFDLGWVAKSQAPEVGVIMIAVPFVLQLIASVFSYLARDGAAGAATGLLATTWLAIGVLHVVSPGRTSGALGLLLLSAAVVLALSAAAMSLGKVLMGAVVLLAATRFALAGIYELSANGSWQDAAGILGLVVCGLAAYAVLAFELEGQQRKTVLPTFRHGRGERSLDGEWSQQLDGIVHEAGVRQVS